MPEDIVVTTFDDTAAELHALPMPIDGNSAELWVMRPTAPALAMGSSQKPDQFDRDRLDMDDIELAARRSGGGAVFIDPASTVWIDIVAPRSSALWSSDIGENFLIVGRIWQTVFASFDIETQMCVTSPGRTAAASLACWAGVGWGELTIGAAKVVGLSQRRTRWGSRVQSMAVLDSSSSRVGDYLRNEYRSTVAGAISTEHSQVIAAAALTRTALEAAVIEAFTVEQ